MREHAKGRATVVALAVLAMLLVLAPIARAEFGVSGEYRFGSDYTGAAEPGEFMSLGSAGINRTGTGATAGDIFVLDRGGGFFSAASGGRIQQFSQSSQFRRLWGTNVVASGPGNSDEAQILMVKATAGTYTLTFGGATTVPIAFDASAATVETALEGLSTIGAVGGTVEVSGGPGDATGSTPYRITFGGATGGANQPLIVASPSGLSGGAAEALVAQINPGNVGFEICEPNRGDVCRQASKEFSMDNFTGGSLSDTPVSSLAIDQTTGAVYAPSFRRINRYSPDGEFERSFGFDAVFVGPGDSSVNEQQRLVVQATGGTYTFSFLPPCCGESTSVPIAFDWPAADPGTPGTIDSVEEAINAMASVRGLGGRVEVSGGPGDPAGASPYLIDFGGTFAGDDVQQFSTNAGELTGSPRKAEVTTSAPGGGPEICIAARNDACGTMWPSNSTAGGSVETYESALTVAPPTAPNAGNILATERFGNRVVEFTGEGEFVRAFGWDVNQAGGAGFEICASGEACKSGMSGTAVGQFGTLADIAVEPSGAIYTLEQGSNRRVQKFVPSGASLTPSLFGRTDERQTVTVRATAGSFRLSSSEYEGAVGTGTWTWDSPVISNVVTSKGEFQVGQPIYGPFPPGTTIISVSPGQVVASNPSPSLCSFGCGFTANMLHTTPDLPAIASAAEVETALNALPTIGGKGGTVSVSGGPGDATGSNPFTISFDGGAIAGTDPPQLVGSQGTTPLSGGSGEGANEAGVATTAPAGATGTAQSDMPVAVSVGAGGEIYVAKRYRSGDAVCGNGELSPTETRILTFPADGSAVSGTTSPCAGLAGDLGTGARQELELDPVSGDGIFTQDGNSGGAPNRIFVFGEVGGPPTLTLDDASELTPTGATVTGTITPNGPGPVPYPNPSTTKYRVEYRETGATEWQLFSDGVPVGGGFDPEPFSIGVGGLEPKTEYQIRVVATKPHGFPEVSAVTAPFTTLAAPPRIETFSSTNVTIDSADLLATINPRGTATSFHFEYGTTPEYGSRTPEVEIGDSATGVEVQAHLENLDAVVYHFRVVATNSEGTVHSTNQTFNFYPENCPNATVRQQTGSGALPDCRAYELVSPGDAGTALLALGGPNPSWASSPPRFAFTASISPIPGPWNPPSGLTDVPYVATRTAQGWETQYVGFPADVLGNDWYPGPNAESRAIEGDLGLGHFLVWPQGHMYSSGPHIFDSNGNDVGRLPTNAAQIPGANIPPEEGGSYGDWEPAPDLSHYFFSSANVAFAPGGLTSGTGSVYDNEIGTGEVDVASRLSNGDHIPPAPGPLNADHYLQLPAVSDDGSHALIAAPAACPTNSQRFNCPISPARLYMRVDGSVTYEVSHGAAVDFKGMTRDGSRVVFTSAEDLSGDDTDGSVDLFIWDEATDSIERLSDAGAVGGDTDSCNASWTSGCGVEVVPQSGGGIDPNSNYDIAIPTDNSIAAGSGATYFYSPEQLVTGEGFPGRRNLYVADGEGIRYVATFDADRPITRIQVSPDGDFAAFVTTSRITSYDNTTEDGSVCLASGYYTQGDSDHCKMMYVYERKIDLLRCVSCKLSGERPESDAEASLAGRFMSDDGRTFFSTKDALVPPDTNEDGDVYEFVNSRPHLITSGAEIGDEYRVTGLVGVSADATDVFFSTLETLVADDENGRYLKIYTARTNGGFPVSAQIAPCQAADECHGGSSVVAPPPTVSSTAGLGASGNHRIAKKGKAKKATRCHRRRGRRTHRRTSRARGAARVSSVKRGKRSKRCAAGKSRAKRRGGSR